MKIFLILTVFLKPITFLKRKKNTKYYCKS